MKKKLPITFKIVIPTYICKDDYYWYYCTGTTKPVWSTKSEIWQIRDSDSLDDLEPLDISTLSIDDKLIRDLPPEKCLFKWNYVAQQYEQVT